MARARRDLEGTLADSGFKSAQSGSGTLYTQDVYAFGNRNVRVTVSMGFEGNILVQVREGNRTYECHELAALIKARSLVPNGSISENAIISHAEKVLPQR